MSTIYIVHLSDLHISSKSLTSTLKKLIDDIKKQTKNIGKLVVVVSGDVVDKGNFKAGQEGVITFFQKLEAVLNGKVVEVLLVPGNHDKIQNGDVKLFGEIENKEKLNIDEKTWELQKDYYKDYLRMANEIRQIFKLKDDIEETFFVNYINYEGYIVYVVGLNTTWMSYGSEEEGDLLIGKYQLDKLYREYKDKKEENEGKGLKTLLTIGIGHHPTSWVNAKDRKTLKKYMIDDEYFGMNLYLCGHIHDMEIENWHNSNSSMMTLVTGVGWNHIQETASEKDKKDEHRYSIYAIDASKNVINISVRKTNKSGNFTNDYSLYSDDGKNILTYPLAIRTERQPILSINSCEQNLNNGLFIDKEFLDLISKMHSSMLRYEKKVTELSYYYTNNTISNIVASSNKEQDDVVKYLKGEIIDINSEIKKCLGNNTSIVCDAFFAYVQEISNYFIEFASELLDSNQVLRIHFRIYDEKADEYIRLCQCSSNSEYKDGVKNVGWDSLIKSSYELKKSLIYSTNSKNTIKTEWDDFMTLVPDFWNNETEIVIGKRHEKRPIITVGISVRGFEPKVVGSNILYVLEYLGISDMMRDILDGYVMKYQLNVVDFMKYINR